MSMEEKYPPYAQLVRVAEAQITAFSVVVEGTADGQCNMPGGADVGGVLGVALHDAAPGEDVHIAGPGSYAKVRANGAIARGAHVSIAGTSGKVKSMTLAANSEVVGQCRHTTTSDNDFTFIYVNPSPNRGG